MSVPGIGAKVADKILELREAKGDLELDDLNQVPYLRITQPLLDKHAALLIKINNKNTCLFILWCMCVYTIYNGPDLYTGPLLSIFV
jgi:hypothetical protein